MTTANNHNIGCAPGISAAISTAKNDNDKVDSNDDYDDKNDYDNGIDNDDDVNNDDDVDASSSAFRFGRQGEAHTEWADPQGTRPPPASKRDEGVCTLVRVLKLKIEICEKRRANRQRPVDVPSPQATDESAGLSSNKAAACEACSGPLS